MRLPKFMSGLGLIALAMAGSAQAAGDLLVAPTRVVLDGARGTEVILNNIDSETATYRVSLEVRRMNADGTLDEIEPEKATAAEAQALSMITYAPRRVELAPNQPQAIRISVGHRGATSCRARGRCAGEQHIAQRPSWGDCCRSVRRANGRGSLGPLWPRDG